MGAKNQKLRKSLSKTSERAVVRSAILADFIHYKDMRFKEPGDSALMSVNGSGTPVDFKVAPAAGDIFQVSYITLLLLDAGTMGPSVFGSLGAGLTNGLELHAQINGQAHVFTNLKDNGDLFQCFFGGQSGVLSSPAADAGFLDTVDKAGGRMVFDYPVTLDGDKGDFISMKVQDDLLAIDFLKMSAHLRQIQ